MLACSRGMDWKCERHRCSTGQRSWKTESADWKTGVACSGRRSWKRWAKKTRSDGFAKWSGSVEQSCSRMGVGNWTIADCELQRGKRERWKSEERRSDRSSSARGRPFVLQAKLKPAC